VQHVRDAMSTTVLTVGPEHTLRQVAERMAERNVGSAVVLDPEASGPGIITERDVLRAVAAGEDPATTLVDRHHVDEVTVASPDTTIVDAAHVMLRGGFRHLVVIDDRHEIAGVLSMRDVVRVWAQEHGPSL
jgi:CBS domain-containing protein